MLYPLQNWEKLRTVTVVGFLLQAQKLSQSWFLDMLNRQKAVFGICIPSVFLWYL